MANELQSCSKCGKDLPLDSFAQYKGKKGQVYRRHYCRLCGRADQSKNLEKWEKTSTAEKKAYVDGVKAAPCMDCKGQFPPVCMDFDHVRGSKKLGIAKIVYQHYSLAVLIAEIAKCDLVCANCHRIRTHSGDLHRQRVKAGRVKAGLPVKAAA